MPTLPVTERLASMVLEAVERKPWRKPKVVEVALPQDRTLGKSAPPPPPVPQAVPVLERVPDVSN